ncbi:MAG TPA: biotin-dependent carboxyltransferase family protein [Candidatus Limnocylindria bacterium]|nr:biotin-dependent carboxyltransferase family protein [Candidatus Limnocylindria bacterium]
MPGLRATIQDRGRFGHLRAGIPPAGPADPIAFAGALDLAGCGPDEAAIEVIGLPFTFRCDDRRVVAATGRDVRLRTRGRVPGWTSVLARPGEEVVVEGSARTRFAYVAVSGGFALPRVLGSRAAYLPAALGPIPRPLAAGDELPLGPSNAGVEAAGQRVPAPEYGSVARAIAGPHDARFPDESVARFFSAAFTVLPESDRMGLRLAGEALAGPADDLLTCGIVAGAVQVPRGGAPIVLLADHQTTGGYPIIATVIRADLGVVAQAAAGEYLRFDRVTPGGTHRST